MTVGKHVGYQGDMQEIEQMTSEFLSELRRVGKNWIMNEKNWRPETKEGVRELAKELVRIVRSGRGENLEVEVAFLAACVWYGRKRYDLTKARLEYDRDDLTVGGEAEELKAEFDAWSEVGATGKTESK